MTNERCYSQEAENPAFDCLRRACALFPRADGTTETMKCPICDHDMPPRWQNFYAVTGEDGKQLKEPQSRITAWLPSQTLETGDIVQWAKTVIVRWMVCSNDDCRQILILIGDSLHPPTDIPTHDNAFRRWYGLPPFRTRKIDPTVPDPFKSDYQEAASILKFSPRMSAVLGRKVLADLLEQYGHVPRSIKLSKMIDDFIKQPGHPSHVTDNLHYLREIADFSAHTQKDELGNIVSVEPEEAEWTLETLDTLFDYFILGPEKDKARRANFDKKVAAAGRKPIKSVKKQEGS